MIKRLSFIKAGVVAILTIATLYYLTSTYSLAHACSRASSTLNHSDVIPNRVHYVHIMPDNPSSDIRLEFKHFLSIYSASLYFQPDVIYIHTDATYDSIERAQAGSFATGPDKWARLILNLPSVVIRHVSAPETASGSGIAITRIEHKSDFIRTKVVYEHGGMYMDWDVYALRDVKPLRELGFANVVGRQKLGAVNSGCWMSRKGTRLMELWVRDQHEVYTGGWTIHSNDLLSSLAEHNGDGGLLANLVERLVPMKKEVLILDRMAFAPSSWELEDAKKLFERHPAEVVESSLSATAVGIGEDARVRWDNRDKKHFLSWEIDYSGSYVLHAFKATHNQKIEGFDPEGITIKYVLSRDSNFASAVYPALKHAIDAGIISVDD